MKQIRIHQTLQHLLKLHSWSISELGRRSGVPLSTLSTWLLPEARPSDPQQIEKVASALGTSMHYLLFGEPENKNLEEFFPGQVVLDGFFRVRIEKILKDG
jgi:transcriptional regulator with XRE-family HTH domain